MASDYVYKNKGDTIRIRIFKKDLNNWDFDIFKKGVSEVITCGVEGATSFDTKRTAKAEAVALLGSLYSINPENTVTEGWK